MANFFMLYKFSLDFYILHLDDGSLEPKRYSVDFASQ